MKRRNFFNFFYIQFHFNYRKEGDCAKLCKLYIFFFIAHDSVCLFLYCAIILEIFKKWKEKKNNKNEIFLLVITRTIVQHANQEIQVPFPLFFQFHKLRACINRGRRTERTHWEPYIMCVIGKTSNVCLNALLSPTHSCDFKFIEKPYFLFLLKRNSLISRDID
jgi:hypothetical protein